MPDNSTSPSTEPVGEQVRRDFDNARDRVAPLVKDARSAERYTGKGLDQHETFAWMHKRIYEELEPEIEQLRASYRKLEERLRDAEQENATLRNEVRVQLGLYRGLANDFEAYKASVAATPSQEGE